MRKKKYMMSGGLAFSEADDMKKLRQKSLEGWHLKRFRCAGYELEKGESEDVIYSIDYRVLEPDEKEEYFEMFTAAGWTSVCSDYYMHIFKADKGTVPIYSDTESARDKINRQAIPVKMVAILTVSLTIILGILMKFTSGTVQNVIIFFFYVAFILALPAAMTYLATVYHRFKK